MVVGNRRCETCKHFYRPPPGPNVFNECHRYPPITTCLFLGMAPNGKPNFHLDVRFAITDPAFVCGEYAPSLMHAGQFNSIVDLPAERNNGS